MSHLWPEPTATRSQQWPTKCRAARRRAARSLPAPAEQTSLLVRAVDRPRLAAAQQPGAPVGLRQAAVPRQGAVRPVRAPALVARLGRGQRRRSGPADLAARPAVGRVVPLPARAAARPHRERAALGRRASVRPPVARPLPGDKRAAHVAAPRGPRPRALRPRAPRSGPPPPRATFRRAPRRGPTDRVLAGRTQVRRATDDALTARAVVRRLQATARRVQERTARALQGRARTARTDRAAPAAAPDPLPYV